MKRLLWTLLVAAAAAAVRAETIIGVQLFDMYKVEAVSLMSPEQFKELKAEIAEEKSVFNKAMAKVKKDWDKQFADARKAGDKDFPKYPTKPFVFLREIKSKTFTTQKAADAWFAKQKGRVDGEMVARLNAQKNAMNAAKRLLDTGYSSRDEKKSRKKAEKADMDNAVKEKLAEFVEVEMSAMLKFNRPIKRHYIFDPLVGPDTHTEKKIAAFEAAYKAYQERKAKGEEPAEGAAPGADK